ncbi:MAG: hypothetical protein ACHQ6T_05525 [Myxococcota bacterium]
MVRIRRGAAHCRTRDCREREKLVPLVPIKLDFHCPACGRAAAVDLEYGTGLGASKAYNEVRVYFAFDAATRTYTDFARAEDSTLVGQHSAYAFFSPLVCDRSEAELLARQLLTRLNGERGDVRPLSMQSTRQELLEQGWRLAV